VPQKPGKFVIGMQRPFPRSFWKIPYIHRGIAPVEAEDPEVAPLIRRCAVEKKTLVATFTCEALSLAGFEPLLSHSFEWVMPGSNYVASVRNFWRVCSGINAEAQRRVVSFLSDVIEVDKYPLTVLDRPIESETCKIVENSYRAAIFAFLDEFYLFFPQNPTHNAQPSSY